MVLLSFDIEEFDMPFEYKRTISFEEQMAVSIEGTKFIIDMLNAFNIPATFFCTANFANNAPDLTKKIVGYGHELASHGYYHTGFEPSHLLSSKLALESIVEKPVTGFRMPRMMPVDEKEIAKAGYVYNTSINPTYIPGRYNNLKLPRTYFYQDNVLQVPASVSPAFRIPLFWLSFHNFPLSLYKFLCKRTYRKDGYLNLYFHPWEFADLKGKYGLPGYVTRNSGIKMSHRIHELIGWMQSRNYPFGTFKKFIETTVRPNN